MSKLNQEELFAIFDNWWYGLQDYGYKTKDDKQAYQQIKEMIQKPSIDWKIIQRIASIFAKSTTGEIAYINKLEKIFIEEGIKVVIHGRNKDKP